MDKLIKAYPAFLARHDEGRLIWKDGTVMAVSDGRRDKSFDERLRSASIVDQLSLPYPKGPLVAPPAPNDDPGRFRNTAFFYKMYGGRTKDQTQSNLVTVSWLGGQELRVTAVNHSHEGDYSRQRRSPRVNLQECRRFRFTRASDTSGQSAAGLCYPSSQGEVT